MPTVHRLPNMSIRVNVPDHPPPHVHVVLADRRDALVDVATLVVTSRTVKDTEISEALIWIKANRELCEKVFGAYNP